MNSYSHGSRAGVMERCYYPRALVCIGRDRAAYNRYGSRLKGSFSTAEAVVPHPVPSVAGQTGHGSDDLSSPERYGVIIRLLMTLTRGP